MSETEMRTGLVPSARGRILPVPSSSCVSPTLGILGVWMHHSSPSSLPMAFPGCLNSPVPSPVRTRSLGLDPFQIQANLIPRHLGNHIPFLPHIPGPFPGLGLGTGIS